MTRIEHGPNPYSYNVQGKANEPVCIAGILERAQRTLGVSAQPSVTLEAIYDRLEENAPRIAVIGGSPDHPAHIMDYLTSARTILRIWENGGVPFYFSVPVLCDGTAQNTVGMSYSLQSRNAIAEMVANQMEAQSYHGAVVLQSCDKHPTAVLAALAMLDRTRQLRGDAPVFCTFMPAHVLRGGVIPDDLRTELEAIAGRAEARGHAEIAEDLRDTLRYILQCSSNTAFQGVLERAVRVGLLSHAEHKAFEKRLAVHTCHEAGGVCAFNGTGNSSRHLMSGLGLAHPAVELLTEPPDQARVNVVIDDLFGFCNRPEYSVGSILARNIANGVRIHSATGGSSNLIMHLVAAMIFAGYQFDIHAYDAIRRAHPIPDLFNYSLTQGRDIFVLAQQCCDGMVRGMETMVHELVRHGVPMDLDAPTVTGTTWRQRLAVDPDTLPAERAADNPIILPRPRRPISGIDVFTGNWFESCVVKISGMEDWQLDEFDDKLHVCLYFESEQEANDNLLNPELVHTLRAQTNLSREELLTLHRHNSGAAGSAIPDTESRDELFDRMVRDGTLKVAVIISGQGPAAYGMPEMFTPMQHLNANHFLKRRSVLISDGRYSGVSYGCAFGHVTPEAFHGGAMLSLRTGDILRVRLRRRRIDLVDREALSTGRIVDADVAAFRTGREDLAATRMARLRVRVKHVTPANRLSGCTDAAHGVAPQPVWDDADLDWRQLQLAGLEGSASEPH